MTLLDASTRPGPTGGGPVEHLDVLIVGAGLSGIGAACHLRRGSPGRTFAILESREASGGTWDLFRYPGIRSDSDMYTLGYSFKPWPGAKSIADGPSILEYVRETAREYRVDETIRYRQRVVSAEWSTPDARWTVVAERTDTGETVRLTCGFLFTCSGYYRYDEGFTPHFEGRERFRGTVVHPQQWPEDLDYSGKRVVIIGSGATAVTLVPSMAGTAAHVTMLQRSPSYIAALPARDPIADRLRQRLPATTAYKVIRWKNVLMTMASYQLSRRRPTVMKSLLRKGQEKLLPGDFDFAAHLTPRYDPWDQRLCLVPDGDLFTAISDGGASIVTGTIDTFTETGVRLTSGAELEADVIITATGLNMLAIGGIALVVDGEPVTLSETVGYKGMMFSGVPNFAAAIGYTNASWTLKCDLVSDYVVRLLDHMDAKGYRSVMARWTSPTTPTRPFVDLTSGYVRRSIDEFPKQGDRAPWRLYQNYLRDLVLFRFGKVEDGVLEFDAASTAASERQPARV